MVEARREGRLYDDFFSDEEFLALEALAEEQSLESEVRLVRVALRRLLEDFGREYGLRGVELERRALTLYKGAETLARLLRQQRELKDDENSFEAVMKKALSELHDEWGIELVPGEGG